MSITPIPEVEVEGMPVYAGQIFPLILAVSKYEIPNICHIYIVVG